MFKRNSKIETFVGKKTTLSGDIKTSGTIRIDGSLEGNIEADWVILGGGGFFKGQIVSKGTIISGRVEGTIKASEIIEIKAKGEIKGDILTPKISIMEGGRMIGTSAIPESTETSTKKHNKDFKINEEKQSQKTENSKTATS